MTIGAFIDIDGTLYRDSLMIEHFKKLVKYEVIDPILWHSHVKHTREIWLKRMGEYDAFMLEIAEIYTNALKGMNEQKLDFISDQVIKLQGDMVYSYTRERIMWHKRKGHKIFFISGSPNHLVSKMAEKYEATDFRGSVYLLDEDGNYTGEVIPMWDSHFKNLAMDNFIKKYEIDPESSFAYGDTNGDLSMLTKVGNPIATNPTRELLESIKSSEQLRSKAIIIVERKDLIYKLTPDVVTIDHFESDI
jgi:HAD superfamily hydrolase (TIGR01490 family)